MPSIGFSPNSGESFLWIGFIYQKNLEKFYAGNPFEMKINADFEGTIRACAERSSTWISKEIIESYVALNKLGHAMSFEAWKEGELVGGLYGVSLQKSIFWRIHVLQGNKCI